MKLIKNKIPFLIILVGIFSFTSINKDTSKINFNNIDIIKVLSKEEFQCRPSSEFMFYVESSLLKKQRGFNIVKAEVFILNRSSGDKAVLASEEVIIPNSSETILQFENSISIPSEYLSKNGDFSIKNNSNTPFSLRELIVYNSIYSSYINSTNKLLKLERSL